MISVNKTASSHDPIVHSARFCVNLLKEAQTDVAKRFSGFFGHKGEDRFGGAQWSTLQTGAPALVGALASFDCEVAETKAFQSHTIFFGTVVAIAAEQGGFDPLLYVNRDYAALRIVNG